MVETIHPADIESELGRIWESFQGTNKMRACLFNLIIYAQKGQRNAYLNQIAQKVIEKFPSRIIFITYDESCKNHDLRTRVSVLTADEGENEIACDLIEVEVCSKHHPIVPFVILPHILPDLPVYLVHADDPTEPNPIAEQLEHLAKRIIFDSESACNLPAFAKAVLKLKDNSHAEIADLNWARTEGWRQLFANVFKSSDELERLKGAKKMTIAYNSLETDFLCHTDIQSIYLQTWIAVQLGWNLSDVQPSKNSLRFSYSQGLQIELIPSEMQGLSPGRILSIEIETESGYHYSFKRNPECPHHITIEKSSQEYCSLPMHFVLDKDVSGQSLVKEICHKGTSTHYIHMLNVLSGIKNEQLNYE
ncbi:MAG: glucose-6-phosphate dehydrogenase assembly protein OpcA [Simkaniaceae bacterium]